MYQLNNPSGVIRLADNASIPEDVNNRDWRDYLAWVEEGNEPLLASEKENQETAGSSP